jgi:organic hydroperoxide reductase OsmC/OhrA
MPAPFPHVYQARLVRTLGSRARIESALRTSIAGGPPPELDGDVASWSPEHLLLSSLGLCLLTTFEALAARDHVELLAWEASVSGTLTKTSQGLEIARVRVEIDMEVSDPERAGHTLDDTRAHCPIAKALRAPIDIIARICASGERRCYTHLPSASCST